MSDNPIPSMHLVQAEALKLEAKGYEVHTMNLVLNDGDWQVTIEGTDEWLDNHRFLYDLDRYGWHLAETEKHRA